MKVKKIDNYYVIRLERGEELITKLYGFCQENEIKSGYFNGLGAVGSVEIALYSFSEKKYYTKTFEGDFEIASLFGTISEPNLHVHIVVGDSEMKCFGGHLKKAVISCTGEIVLVPGTGVITRYEDKEIGLNLMEI